MSVDIFIEMLVWVPAAGQTPKIEPVVPNLMSASLGSRPARAGEAVAAMAETMKWRRLSIAFPIYCYENSVRPWRHASKAYQIVILMEKPVLAGTIKQAA